MLHNIGLDFFSAFFSFFAEENWVVITRELLFLWKPGFFLGTQAWRICVVILCSFVSFFDLKFYSMKRCEEEIIVIFWLFSFLFCRFDSRCVVFYLPKNTQGEAFTRRKQENSAKTISFYCYYYRLMCYKNHFKEPEDEKNGKESQSRDYIF